MHYEKEKNIFLDYFTYCETLQKYNKARCLILIKKIITRFKWITTAIQCKYT